MIICVIIRVMGSPSSLNMKLCWNNSVEVGACGDPPNIGEDQGLEYFTICQYHLVNLVLLRQVLAVYWGR